MRTGRPREYDWDAIRAAFEKYIARTPIPIVAEFAAKQGLAKQWLHDREDFSDLVKRCTTKKEQALERHALKGKVNTAMAIFSLKQLGWSDKLTHQGDPAAPLALNLTGSDVNG